MSGEPFNAGIPTHVEVALTEAGWNQLTARIAQDCENEAQARAAGIDWKAQHKQIRSKSS